MQNIKREWSYKIDGADIVFHQKNYTLRIPRNKLSKTMITELESGQVCGGCIDLPLHGYYSSGKFSWCAFSRDIANLYDTQYKWILEDPPMYYLFIVTKQHVTSAEIEQVFYLKKCTQRNLKSKIKKMQKLMIQEASLGRPEPYILGYVPSETHNISDGVIVVDDNFIQYSLAVKKFEDGKAI